MQVQRISEQDKTYYAINNGTSLEDIFGQECLTDFSVLQKRTIENFNWYDNYSKAFPDFGLRKDSCLSQKIQEMQNTMYKKYQ